MTGRLGPRPLPLHLTMEGMVLQLCFAGLTPWSNGSPLSKPIKDAIEAELGIKSTDVPWHEHVEPKAFLDALTQRGQTRLAAFSKGISAYQHHPHRRNVPSPPQWAGTAAAPVLDYGGPENGVPVLVVPSLINKSYVLDLFEDRSFMRALASLGLRPYLLDWTAEDAAPSDADVTHYIQKMLVPALADLKQAHGRPAALVGYCMGGTLCVAPAAQRHDLISSLVLLAAPWDFHADSEGLRHWLSLGRPVMEQTIQSVGEAPVDLLQALFAGLDPTLTGRKFRSFAEMDPDSDAAKRFVVLEDWLNDGVPLAGPTAEECLFDWFLDNTTFQGGWKVDGQPVLPEKINCPTLAVIPARDRIVPPKSAEALAEKIPGADVQSVALGHIGMMTGGRAQKEVYEPVAEWIKNAASQ